MLVPLFFLILFSGCCHQFQDISSPYSLTLFVDAPHLNYRNGDALIRSIVKHPRDWSKNGDVGHAWIRLQGDVEGHPVVIEGGHSGELGSTQPRYFDGIMNYLDYGYSNPTPQQKREPIYEPNPVKYLWESQSDGFFQKGSGNHRPTFSIQVELTKDQFTSILNYIDPRHYDYSCYALTGNQCTSFVVNVAQIAGIELYSEIKVPIPQEVRFRGRRIRMWCDPCYASIRLQTPDTLEAKMLLLKRSTIRGYSHNVQPIVDIKSRSCDCRCQRRR